MKRVIVLVGAMLAAGCGVGGGAGGPNGSGGSNGSDGKADRGDNPLGLIVTYAQDDGHVRVSFARSLSDGQAMFIRLRRGHFGTLDCAQVMRAVDPVDTGNAVIDARHDPAHLGRTLAYLGPAVAPELIKAFYGPEWQNQPTAQMVAAAKQGTDRIIDTCLVSGFDAATRTAAKVEVAVETDFDVAWDNATPNLVVPRNARHAGGAGGIAVHNDTMEQPIHSVQKYAEACVRDLGEIPFFQKTAEGEYSTYSCLDSTAIPMTVTDETGNVTKPDGEVDTCDKPQYIYSLCEQGPRVAHKTNEEGTHWVLLCRKSIGGLASSQYNDMAMIGHNPLTGKTCFFQNALYSKTDGAHVPHPGDKVKSETLWSGVHGGLGSGIECARCHDNDPFIHSPWIDGALDGLGKPVVPKMGFDPDFVSGYNDAPYDIVNTRGQGWEMPKSLISPEAQACTKCHRIGSGRWLDWASRLDGTDSSFKNMTTKAYQAFDKLHWMPIDLRVEGLTEANWADSKFAKALDFIKACGNDQSRCQWKPLPTEP
jgi:hypothetical protein